MSEILFLTHRLPYPPNKGERIRAWHFLRHLIRSHRVHLGSFSDAPQDRAHFAMLRDLCAEFYVETIGRSALHPGSLQALAKGMPITVRHFQRSGMARWVNDLVGQHRPEVIFAYSGVMSQYLPDPVPYPCRRIIDFVDVDAQKWRQYAESTTGLRRWLYRREARELQRYERRAAQRASASLFVSPAEAALFQRIAPESADKTITIENGVDTDLFCPDPALATPPELGAESVAFVGAMNYRPNIDGAVWFAREVLPLVRRENPAVEFAVVGANPASEVMRLARDPDVVVTGSVERTQPYLAHARLVVVPLRMSQGVPNKILEAMAMAKAVITTPVALRGLGRLEPGRDLLVAEDATDFAQLTRQLLASPEQARMIGERARHCVLEHYGWQKSFHKLDRLLEDRLVSMDAG